MSSGRDSLRTTDEWADAFMTVITVSLAMTSWSVETQCIDFLDMESVQMVDFGLVEVTGS